MRLLLMATYLGVPYQAGLGPDGNQVTLFSPAPPPEELGFAAGPGHWRKQVSVTELTALWQSRPVGDYRGEPCLVLDDLGDRLHIAYLGRDTARAAQLGYWEIDREVFEVVVAQHEVTGLVEERVEFPLAAAMFPPSGLADPTSGPAAAVTEMPGQAGYDGEAALRGDAAAGYADSRPEETDDWPGETDGRQGETADRPGETDGRQGETADRPGETDGRQGETDGLRGDDGRAAEDGSRAAGNGRADGHADPDHAPRMPDRVAAWHGSPAPEPWPEPPAGDEAGAGSRSSPWPERDHRSELWAARSAGPAPWTERWNGSEPGPEPRNGREPGSEPDTTQGPTRRSGRKDRISPDSVFAELLSLAAIPQAAYAVDEEVPGAMCLVEADGGFEVFSRTDDARLEVQFFEDEEAAYFYLFGVLAAEAIRSGRLAPSGSDQANGHHNGTSAPTMWAAAEDISKYLRGRKLPESTSHTGIVHLAGGADGPPLPKQPRRSPSQVRKGASCVSQIGLFAITSQTSFNFTTGLLVRFSPQGRGDIVGPALPGTVAYVRNPAGSRVRSAARVRADPATAESNGLAAGPAPAPGPEEAPEAAPAAAAGPAPAPGPEGAPEAAPGAAAGAEPAAGAEGAPEPAPAAAGVASLAVRDLLRGPRRHGKVLAVLPQATYLEFADVVPEPRVIAISPPDAIRLPNAIITGPFQARASAECWAGEDRVVACGLDIRIMRWWDPSPVFGPLSRARLDHGCGLLAKLCTAAGRAPGLTGHDGPARLAACCANGDLAGAVEAVEQLVGLGPGLVPSGDSVVSGVLLALRLLGGAISGGTRAVWLADWLSASATCDAAQRTTSLAASLLHCAAGGQAAAEVSAVLLGMAGHEPLEPAAARLLAAAQGADLAWGLVAGCRAALLLSVS